MIAEKASNQNPEKRSHLEDPVDGNDETRGGSVGTAQWLADRASEVVAQRPGTCLAVGFLVGGVVAWLMSKRS